MVLGLGVGNAAIYYLNKRELTLRDVVSAHARRGARVDRVTAVVVALIAPWAGDERVRRRRVAVAAHRRGAR